MPIISEAEATRLVSGYATSTPEEQEKNKPLLIQYREHHTKQGTDPFPTQTKARRDEREQFYNTVENPALLAEGNALFADDPADPALTQELRHREVNAQFLARRYGKPIEQIREKQDYYADDYAAQKWNEGVALDPARFYARVKDEVGKEKQQGIFQNELMEAAFSASMLGDKKGWSQWIESARSNPAYKPEHEGRYFDAWNTVKDKVEEDLGENAWAIRSSVLKMREDKGLEGDLNQAQAAFQHPERQLVDLLTNNPAGYQKVKMLMQKMASLGTTEEKAGIMGWAQKFGESLQRGAADTVDGILDGTMSVAAPTIANALGREDIARRTAAEGRVMNDLKDIANGIVDPVSRNNWFDRMAFGLADSAPAMLLGQGRGARMQTGRQVLALGYAGEAKRNFEDNGWTGAGSAAAASTVGVMSAAVESISEGFRLPKAWRMTTQSMIKNYGAELAFRAGSEITEELIQDNMAAVTQTITSAIGLTPERDKGLLDEIKEWGENSLLDVALVSLPLAALGAKTGASDRISRAKVVEMTADKVQLARMLNADTAETIAAIQDPDERLRAFQSAYGEESAADRVKHLTLLSEINKYQERYEQTMADTATSAISMTVNRDGWQVTQRNGETITVDSADAARRVREELRQVQTVEEAAGLISAMDSWVRKGSETKPRSATLSGELVQSDGTAIIHSRDGKVTKTISDGKALTELRAEAELIAGKNGNEDVFVLVNGSNSVFVDKVGGIVKGVVKRLDLNQSGVPQVMTFLHESLESSFNEGLLTGTLNKDMVTRAAKALFPVMDPSKAKDGDEKRLIESLAKVAAGNASDTEMRETLVELAVRDVLERDVKGRRTGYRAGTFAKALDAAMMTATSKEEVTAFGKIAEFFRAISTMLKGVFGTVQALNEAKEAGTLAEGNDFELFVDQMLGLDEQQGFDSDLTGDVETLVAETYSVTSAPLRATSAIAKDKGIPSSITPEVAAEFKDRPIAVGMADLIGASGEVRGVDVHGGSGYPVEKFDKALPKKITAVWASMRTGIQSVLANMEKTGAIWQDEKGHHWALYSPHTMSQEAHRSNAQTPLVYLAKVNKMATNGAISHDHIIEISTHIRSMVPGAVEMPDLGTVEAETFFGSASFETRANIMAELTTARSRDLGAPSPDSILTESRDPQYHGVKKDALTSLLLIDIDRMATKDADGKWTLRKDIGASDFGVDPHPSYDTIMPGRILAHFDHPVPFEVALPEMLRTMKDASPKSRPSYLLVKMPRDAGIKFQPLTDDVVKKINEVQAIGALFPDQKGATLPQIKMMVNAVNGNWTTFEQGKPTKGLIEFTNAIDRSTAKESLTPYTPKQVTDMVKDGTMTVHQLGDLDVWFGIKKGEGASRELVSVVNNTGIPGTLNVIMAKALELGANKLDAYAVVVPGMPKGLLATLYGRHGWKEDSRSKFNRKYLLDQLEGEKPKAFKARIAQKEAALRMYWEEQGWAGLDLPDMVFMSHDGVTRGPELEDEHSASLAEGEAGSIRSASSQVDGTVRGGGNEDGGTDSDGGGTVEPVAPNRGVLPRGADTILGSLASVTDTQLQAIGVTRAEFESFKTNASSITSYSVRTIPPGSAAERSANVSYSVSKADQLKERVAKMSSAQMREALNAATLMPDDAMINLLGRFPEYLNPVIDSIVAKRKQLKEGKITMRDVAKAYFMTVASIGASAIDVETVREKAAERGAEFDPDQLFLSRGAKGQAQIRPEEIAAWWLGTPKGQTALNNIEAGKFDPADWEDGLLYRDTFGRNDLRSKESKTGTITPGAFGAPGKKQLNFHNLKEALDGINDSRGDPAKLEKVVMRINGIGEGKKGFISHMLGFGEWATIDAVEINLWLTGKGDTTYASEEDKLIVGIAKRASSSPPVNRQLFDRIRAGISGLRDKADGADAIPEEVAAHVIHHWIWDRAKGIETTHEGMYHAMTSYSVSKVAKYEEKPREQGDPKSYEEVTERYKGTQNLVRSSEGRVHSSIVRDLLKRRYEGENISPEVMDRAIKEHFPSYPVKVPKTMADLSSEEEIFNAIDKGQREKHIESMERGLPAEGDITFVRQDVPSAKQGVGTVTTRSGENVFYRPATRLKNAKFETKEKATLMIGMDLHNKGPHIKIEGQWMEDQSMPTDLENWTQVGFNPDRHSYYYERGTERQVVSADEIYQVGNTVFSRNPVFEDVRTNISYSVSSGSRLEQVQAELDRRLSTDPARRRQLAQEALLKLENLRERWETERWTAKGDLIRPITEKRTTANLDREGAMRQAMAVQRILTGMGIDPGYATLSKDAKDYEAWQRYQESKAILIEGGMTEAEAERLAAASASTWRSKAVSTVRTAITQAKAEVAAWREEQDAMQKKDWSPKASLLRDLRTLDAMLSVLPVEVRDKVGGFIKLATFSTEKSRLAELNRRVEMIETELEKHLQKEIRGEIKEMFDKAAPKMEAGEKPKGAMTAESHRLAFLALAASKVPAVEVNGERQKLDDLLLEVDADVVDIAERMQILEMFGGMDEMNAASLDAALGWLTEVVGNGRSLWRAKEELRLLEQKMKAEEARMATGREGSIDRLQQNLRDEKTLKQESSGWGYELVSFEQVMGMLFDPNASVVKGIVEGIRRATYQRTDAIRQKRAEWQNAMSAIFAGNKWMDIQADLWDYAQTDSKSAMTVSWMKDRREKKIDVPLDIATRVVADPANAKALGFSDIEVLTIQRMLDENNALPAKNQKSTFEISRIFPGTPTGVPLSQNQAMNLTMLARQKDYQKALEHHGWTEDVIKEIESKLTREAKEMRAFLAEEYRAGYYSLNSVFQSMFGAPLPQILNYSPGTWEGMTADSTVSATGSDAGTGGLSAAMFKTRRKHKAAPRLADAMVEYWKHVGNSEHFKAFAAPVRELKGVLLNPQLRASIEERGGKAGIAAITDWIKVFENDGVKRSVALGKLQEFQSRLQNAIATGVLAWNLGTLAKQSLASLGAAYEMPASEYLLRFSRAMRGKLNIGEIFKSEMIRRRVEQGASPELRQVMQGMMGQHPGSNWVTQNGRKFAAAGMDLLGSTDGYFTSVSAAIYYDWQLDQAKKAGMNDADAAAAAMTATEGMVDRTAQPVETMQKSLFEAKAASNPQSRWVFMFASEARQKATIYGLALNRALKGKSTRQDKQVLFISHVVAPMILQTISSMVSDWRDDDDKELLDAEHWSPALYLRSMMLGPMMGLPLLSGPLNSIISSLTGTTKFNTDATNPIGSAFSGFMSGVTKLNSDRKQKDDPIEIGVNMTKNALNIVSMVSQLSPIGAGNAWMGTAGAAVDQAFDYFSNATGVDK